MAMQYLHDVVHVSEGVGFVVEMFRETRSITVASEGVFVLFETGGELPTSLSDVRSVAVGAG